MQKADVNAGIPILTNSAGSSLGVRLCHHCYYMGIHPDTVLVAIASSNLTDLCICHSPA